MITLTMRFLLSLSLLVGVAAVSPAQEKAEKADVQKKDVKQQEAQNQEAEKQEAQKQEAQKQEAQKGKVEKQKSEKVKGEKQKARGEKQAKDKQKQEKKTAAEKPKAKQPVVEKPTTAKPAAEKQVAKKPAAKKPAAKKPAAKKPAAKPEAKKPAVKEPEKPEAKGAAAKEPAAKEPEAKPTLPKAWVDTLQWRSIGPANMSGRITALAVYEKDPTIWWAASASGGLLKTINNGVTFEHQFDHEATVSIGDVQVAASDPNIVWVGTGEANPRNSVSWGDGVYKSTDGGKTWKNMGLKKSFQIGRIAIHPKDPNIVYVGALGRLWGPSEERGLFKTTDGGKTWKKVLYVDDKTGVIDVQMNLKKPDTLIVATYERERDGFDSNDPAKKIAPGSAVYRTTNGGKSFQKVTKGLPKCNLGRIGITIYRKDPKHVYLVLESEKIGQFPEKAPYTGIQGEDADVGARITQVVAKGPAEASGLKTGDIVISMNGMTIHSYNEMLNEIRKLEAGNKVKLGLSRDRKSVEVEITLGERPKPQSGSGSSRSSSAPRRSSGSPYSASLGGQRENQEQGPKASEHGGVYHSKDGGVTWTRLNSVNPRPMYYSQIRVDPSDNKNIWVLGTSLYLSKDGGVTFSSNNTARGIHVDHHSMWIDPTDGRHVILGNDGGIHATYDRGLHWDHYNHVAIGQFYHVAVGPRRDYSVYGGLQDNGSWGGPNRGNDGRGAINTDWLRIGGGDGFVCQVDPNDPDLVYYESQGGATGRTNLRTGERGSMRPRAPRGTRYRFNWKTPFLLSPHNSKVYYSAGNHVFRSPYEGNNLKAISPDITLTDKGSGSALAESPVEEGVLYVGTTDGALWCSRDGGHEWKNLFGKSGETVTRPAPEEAAEESGPQRPGSAEGGPGGPGGGRRGGGFGGRGGRGGPGGGGPGGRGGGPGRLQEMLKQADADGDGKLQKSEFPEQMIRMFDRLDANSDGVIDQSEIKAMQSRFGRGGSGRPPASRPAEPPKDVTPQEKEKPAVAKPEKPAAAKPQTKEKPAAAKPQTKEKPAEEKKEEPAKPVIKDDDISGTWEGQFKREGMPPERSKFTLVMRMDPYGKIAGSFKSSNTDSEGEGVYDPKTKQVSFTIETEQATLEVTGAVSEKTFTGEVDINGMFSMPIEAKRTGDAPAVAEKTAAAKPGESLDNLLPGPRWVSSIEASRFKRGRAYFTLDGHRSNDDKPHVFVTEDYGQTWRSLVANLPETVGSTRVIREDLKNENVLYLGTEFSIWISVDRGESWTKLNSNLPTVAVHEVAIHPTAGEIVAGTHGRSLWILDVSALRQLTAETIAADAYLYDPLPSVRWRSKQSRGSSGTRKFVGATPSSGAAIYYSLGKNAQFVSLKITDVEGKVLREIEGETNAGLHRISWDLRRVSQRRSSTQRSSGQRGGPPRSSGFGGRGSTVASGKYLITLTVNEEEFKRVLTVEDDPSAPQR